MDDFGLEFIDKNLQTPAHFDLTSLNFSLSNLITSPNSHSPFSLDLNINETGHIKVLGQTTLKPFSSEIKIDIGGFALKGIQSYIDPLLRLDLVSGLFNINAELSIQANKDRPLAIHLQGDSNISEFSSVNPVSKQELIKWKQLRLQQMDFDLVANRFNIDKVILEQPYSKISIRKDKTININDIVISPPQKASAHIKQKKTHVDTKQKPSYKITHFEVIDADLDFSDQSLIIPFFTHIKQLNGSVEGISSAKNTVTHITLAGKAHDIAPVNIKGSINSSQGTSAFEFEFDFSSMPLPLMTPYMVEFVGYKVEKGNISLDLNYRHKSNQLTADNTLLIDRLILGEEIDNPKAASLPLNLAIALLEDSDGKIKLEVPITGSLDDPEFSIASLVTDALFNVITKVVTSPFNAIASLINSDEDVSKVAFATGQALLSQQQQSKLDSLANALSNRKALKLEIKGTAFTEHDWPMLQAQALDDQLLKISSYNKTESIEKNHLNDEQYQDLLADLFIQKFPQLAERSLLGSPQLINAEEGDFYNIAKAKLAAMIPPDMTRLKQLAAERAKTISHYLVDKGISISRIYLLNVAIDPESMTNEQGEIATPLSLTVR
jgi:hypothetical protein